MLVHTKTKATKPLQSEATTTKNQTMIQAELYLSI